MEVLSWYFVTFDEDVIISRISKLDNLINWVGVKNSFGLEA